MNKHEKLLLLSMIALNRRIERHREECHEWNYSSTLKRALTNSKNALERCCHTIDGKIYMEDTILLKNKLEAYHRGKAFVGNNVIKANDYKGLPDYYVDEITTIANLVQFINDELELTIKRKCEKEYKNFQEWYKHFDNFLENNIFI